MLLSDQDIKYYIETEKIIISPYSEKNLNPASYIFTLGVNLLRPMGNDVIDFRKNLLPDYREITIDEQIGYQLNPGELVLGQTSEKITLSKDIAMIIEGRSYLARTGIEVVQTSTFIEPNHSNSIITLEITNNGKSPVIIYPGMPFAKGIFFKLKSPYSGKYRQTTYITQNEVKPPRV
jgi:dCTP deaminase